MTDSHNTDRVLIAPPNGDVSPDFISKKSLEGRFFNRVVNSEEIWSDNCSSDPSLKESRGSSSFHSMHRNKPSGQFRVRSSLLNGDCNTSTGHFKTFFADQVSDIQCCHVKDVCFTDDQGRIYQSIQATSAAAARQNLPSSVKSLPQKDAPEESSHKAIVESSILENTEDAGIASSTQGDGDMQCKNNLEGQDEDGVERKMEESGETAKPSLSCCYSFRICCMARTKQSWQWLVGKISKISVNAQGDNECSMAQTFLINEPNQYFDILCIILKELHI